jgi:hypothetical protein
VGGISRESMRIELEQSARIRDESSGLYMCFFLIYHPNALCISLGFLETGQEERSACGIRIRLRWSKSECFDLEAFANGDFGHYH